MNPGVSPVWPIKRRSRQVSRSQTRNRKSIKPSFDALEGRKLLTFSAISYSIFPKATAMVGNQKAENGTEDTRTFLPGSLNRFGDAKKDLNGSTAMASAKIETTATSQTKDTVQSGTITVVKDDLNNTSVNGASVSSRAQTDFTYKFRSDKSFTFSESGSLYWTCNIPPLTTGNMGSIGIYNSNGALVAGSQLTVNNGRSTSFGAVSPLLPKGEYTIKLICNNNTAAANVSVANGSIQWSINSV
jgi:hypothetical protein